MRRRKRTHALAQNKLVLIPQELTPAMPLTFNSAHLRIGIIGLGYVGLPLAVEFARKYPVVGFDVKQSRIEELKHGEDSTREVDPAELGAVVGGHPERSEGSHPLYLTSTPFDLAPCTVPGLSMKSGSGACAVIWARRGKTSQRCWLCSRAVSDHTLWRVQRPDAPRVRMGGC